MKHFICPFCGAIDNIDIIYCDAMARQHINFIDDRDEGLVFSGYSAADIEAAGYTAYECGNCHDRFDIPEASDTISEERIFDYLEDKGVDEEGLEEHFRSLKISDNCKKFEKKSL